MYCILDLGMAGFEESSVSGTPLRQIFSSTIDLFNISDFTNKGDYGRAI